MTEDGNRPDLVEAARKFMLTKKVRETSFEEQKQFLLNKGLTEAEIAEARASIPEEALAHTPEAQAHHYAHAPQQPNRAMSLAQSVLVIGSVSYAGYRILRSYILPKFFDIPDPATQEVTRLQDQINDLQNSMKFLIDSVTQTGHAINNLSQRDYELTKVTSDISTIKSLMLSGKHFAINASQVNNLPSWQSAEKSPANAAAMSSGAKSDDDEFVDTLTDTDKPLTNGKDSPV